MNRQAQHRAAVNGLQFAGQAGDTAAKRQRLIARTRRVVPFDHILVSGLDLDGLRIGTGTILASSFPKDYIATYYDAGHIGHDPLVKLTLGFNRTVSDQEAWADSRRSGDNRKLLALMGRHGIRNRTVVPLSRSGRPYGSVVVTSARPLTEGEQEYLQFVADQRLARLGLPARFGSRNPFPFMALQDVQEFANFFERRVTAYQVAVGGSVSLDEDF